MSLDVPAKGLAVEAWLRTAVVLCAADLALMLLAIWPGVVTGSGRPLLRAASLGLSLALLAVVMVLVRRVRELRREALAAGALQREMFDALGSGIALWDADDRLQFANAEFRRLYAPLAHLLRSGVAFEDLMRAAVGQGLVPEAVGRESQWLAERMAAHRAASAPMLRQLPPGRWRRVVEQRLPDGSVLGHSVDVSDLVNKEQALRVAQHDAQEAQARLIDAIESLPDAFALYDADDRLAVFNQRYVEAYRESAPLMVVGAGFEEGLRYGLAHGQYPQAAGREEAWLAERLQAHREPGPPLLQELPGNRWMHIVERPTRDGGRAGVRIDVTELVRREQQLRQLNHRLDTLNAELARLSDTDALTGLANRRQFDRRLTEEWSRAHRHGMPLSLLIFDVDHFKRFNDRHGHVAGDQCLRQVAQLLSDCARRPADLVARLGGEEFAMLLPQEDAASAMVQAQRCLRAIRSAALAHGDSPVAPIVSISIGGAHAGAVSREDVATALVAAADAALYTAKEGGRDRAVMAGT